MLASVLLVVCAPILLVGVALGLATLKERAPREVFGWRFLTADGAGTDESYDDEVVKGSSPLTGRRHAGTPRPR